MLNEGMSNLQSIGIRLESIGSVLRDNRLTVPRFQRWYSWEAEHVRDLYTDLWTSFHNKQKEYFLGSIVLAHRKDAKTPEVVDGQQRLTTATILIAAIRDYFVKVKDEERAADVEREYLFSKDMRTREVVPHLALSDADRDFFSKRILSPPSSPDRKVNVSRDSHDRLFRAARIAADQIKQTAETTNDSTKVLVDWLDLLNAQAKVIVVEVPDDVNAFTIFETLNDRGLELAISDLLKNFIFKASENRIDEVQERWMNMRGALESLDRENVVVSYIRHLWATKHGLTRERDLYTSIKSQITSKQAAVDLATDMAQNARIYSFLYNHTAPFWRDYPASVAENVKILNLLRMSQMRPLLMAITGTFNHAETRDAFRMLVSWTVRFIVTGSLGSGELENNYAQRACEVRANKIVDAEGLLDAMRPIIPTDADFKAQFTRWKVSKSSIARYILAMLERLAGGEIQELVPNENPDFVNREHILPQASSVNWPQITEEDANTYSARLGNFVLMNREANEEVGNQSFERKKEHYRLSTFVLTKQIAEFDEWGPTQIDARQADLAEAALRAWPISLQA